MSKRHAVVNDKGHVVNVIIWDGVSPWSPPEGHIVIRDDHVDIGDRWDHKVEQLVKVCRLHGCEDKSHATNHDVHEEYRLDKFQEK